MRIKSGLVGPGDRDKDGHLKHRRGREWADQGATGISPSALAAFPPDEDGNPTVRMPFRSGGISQYTGERYAAPDKEFCHIDTTPSELGRMPEDDIVDKSRHGGLNHVWHSHPHATSQRFEPSIGLLGRAQWVPDGKGNYRSVNIEAITLPHDCENHLAI